MPNQWIASDKIIEFYLVKTQLEGDYSHIKMDIHWFGICVYTNIMLGYNGPCQSEREIQNNQKLSHHILFTPASHCMCDEQWCWVSEAQYYCTVYYKHAAGEMKYNVITDG